MDDDIEQAEEALAEFLEDGGKTMDEMRRELGLFDVNLRPEFTKSGPDERRERTREFVSLVLRDIFKQTATDQEIEQVSRNVDRAVHSSRYSAGLGSGEDRGGHWVPSRVATRAAS